MNESDSDFLDRLEATAGRRWSQEDRDRIYLLSPIYIGRHEAGSSHKGTQLIVILRTREMLLNQVIMRLDE